MKYLIRSEHPDNHRFAFYDILYAEDDRRTIVWYLAVASVAQLYRRYLPRRTYQNHFFPFSPRWLASEGLKEKYLSPRSCTSARPRVLCAWSLTTLRSLKLRSTHPPLPFQGTIVVRPVHFPACPASDEATRLKSWRDHGVHFGTTKLPDKQA